MNTILITAIAIALALLAFYLFARLQTWLFPRTQAENDYLAGVDLELEAEETPHQYKGWSFHLHQNSNGWYGLAYRRESQIRTPIFPDPYTARNAVERAIDEHEFKEELP